MVLWQARVYALSSNFRHALQVMARLNEILNQELERRSHLVETPRI
jgi:hypothetical protein